VDRSCLLRPSGMNVWEVYGWRSRIEMGNILGADCLDGSGSVRDVVCVFEIARIVLVFAVVSGEWSWRGEQANRLIVSRPAFRLAARL